jgi:hypothetical protein
MAIKDLFICLEDILICQERCHFYKLKWIYVIILLSDNWFKAGGIIFLTVTKTQMLMGTVNISSTEETTIKDFKEGNSVQVRVTVTPADEKEYSKGQKVKVMCGEDEATGKIVSEPLVVRPKTEDGKETISLIVEKV